ncbi:MAG: M23 family metallopeptidase [Bacillota bacterium]
MFTSKSKLKKRKHFTVMLVHHTQKKPHQYKVPFWLLGFSALLVVSIIASAAYFIIDFIDTRSELERLQYVEKINSIQSDKIGELLEKTRSMEAKISEIERLDRQVRELVGLEAEKEEPVSGLESPISFQSELVLALSTAHRGGVSRQLTSRSPEVTLELLDLLDKDLAFLNEVADVQQENLSQLQQEVTEQLNYLAALPNKWPVNGRITSKFGWRKSPFGTGRREFHDGLDLAASMGTLIRAAGDGKVTFSGWAPGYGRMVVISHGYGYTSYYAHNSANLVKVGDTVKKGDGIARVGTSGRTTGPHVHFMIDHKGKRIDPLNVLQ